MNDEVLDDDTRLEALLRRPLEALPDDGFSATVMRRVQAEAASPATIDCRTALQQLQQRDARERLLGRWRTIGASAGIALAAGIWWAGDGPSIALPTPEALALLLGLGAMAWLLALEALRGEA